MTDYIYSKVAVYAELGGALRLARNSRTFVTDPVTAAPVNVTQGAFTAAYFDTDSTGIADFTATTPGPIRLTTGATFVDVYSEELPGLGLAAVTSADASAVSAASSAAAAALSASLVGAPADTAVAAIMGNSASASRVVTDGIYDRTVNRPVNLLDLGADNTGAADVSAVLASAASVGRRIDVPPGTYLLGSLFAPGPGVSLNCEPGVTFLGGFLEGGAGLGLFSIGYDFSMTGGTIDGGGSGGCREGLHILGGRSVIRDVTVTNTRDQGVYVGTTGSADLISVTTQSCGLAEFPNSNGFYYSGSGDVSFTDCVAIGNHGKGFYLDGTGVLHLTNCTAKSNGQYGIDIRTPGATVVGCTGTANTLGGLAVSLFGTGVSTHDIAIAGGTFYNNGPGTSPDFYEVSLSNCDRLSMSGIVIDSNSMTTGLKITGCTSVNLSGVKVRGNHAAYATALQVGVLGVVRSAKVTSTGCTYENYGGTGSVLVLDVDGFDLTGGSISGGAIGVNFIGTPRDINLDPASWGSTITNRTAGTTTPGGNRRMFSSPILVSGVPITGVWAKTDALQNSSPAVGGYKGWMVTVAGGATSATWAATTAYTAVQWIKTAAGKVMECTTAGTSGATEPVMTAVGDVVTDGTAVWTCRALTSATFVSTGLL